MERVILCFIICVLGCGEIIIDDFPVVHAFFGETTIDGRSSLVVRPGPDVTCQVSTLAGESSRWRDLVIGPERHDRLIELVDNIALVDRYRVDAREPGSARECIDGTSTCYDPGINLSPGVLSRLGDAAYVLYITPAVDDPWTEETTEMVDTFRAALDECLTDGTPI
ncbi:MAG: hypothetical protein OEM15_13140 [Myxococcales bacterium]|nr:hypothetical protein [Myxococcales bacterium]MDH3485658.1 hypothetical protein [Myxococcales bacterium]